MDRSALPSTTRRPISRLRGYCKAACALLVIGSVLFSVDADLPAHAVSGQTPVAYLTLTTRGLGLAPGVVKMPVDSFTASAPIATNSTPAAIAISRDASEAIAVGGPRLNQIAIPGDTVASSTAGRPQFQAVAAAPDGNTAFAVDTAGGLWQLPLDGKTSTPQRILYDLPHNPLGCATTWSSQSSIVIAMSPNGSTVYLAGEVTDATYNCSYATVPTYQIVIGIGRAASGSWSSPTVNPLLFTRDDGGENGSPVNGLAVAPDGSKVYATVGAPPRVLSIPSSGGSPTTTALSNAGSAVNAVAVSPDGQWIFVARGSYVVGNSLNSGFVQAFHPGDTSQTTVATLPSYYAFINSLAISPDGAKVLAVGGFYHGSDSDTPYPGIIAINRTSSGWSAGGPITYDTIGGQAAGGSSFNGVAITPDQAPVAAFTGTPKPPGSPTPFDAAGSSVRYGSIANYHWDFGDGSSGVDTGATTASHTYTHMGTYNVTLTETTAAGTSVGGNPPSTVYTGRTESRFGDPQARASIPLKITETPGLPTTSSPSTTLPGTAPTVTPVLTLVPSTGPPGTVVTVTGSQFPAHIPVQLAWSVGITTSAPSVDSGDGSFVTQVLVMPHDELGPRNMTAQGYPTATAAFLVTPDSFQPSGASAFLLFRR